MKPDHIEAQLQKKSRSAVEIATLILGEGATLQDIEDQAFCFMYLPPEELKKMRKRLKLSFQIARRKVKKGQEPVMPALSTMVEGDVIKQRGQHPGKSVSGRSRATAKASAATRASSSNASPCAGRESGRIRKAKKQRG